MTRTPQYLFIVCNSFRIPERSTCPVAILIASALFTTRIDKGMVESGGQSRFSTHLHASDSYNNYINIMTSLNQSLHSYVEPCSLHPVINITYRQAPFYNSSPLFLLTQPLGAQYHGIAGGAWSH